MKRAMNHLVGSAGWALVAAGILGLIAKAAAQSPPQSPWRSTPAFRDREAGKDAPPAEVQQQQALSKVELAWLAEPATFPYRLEARIVGTTLEVHGYVPNEAIHQQVVKIAREESSMRVIDAVNVYSGVAATAVKKPERVLHREAFACLRQELRQRAGGITVAVWNNGQVLIKGSVPTEEDKLAASRCLKRVSGCNCVINQLVVTTPGTKAVTKPTSDPGRAPGPKTLYAQTTWRRSGTRSPSNAEKIQSQAIQPVALTVREEGSPAPSKAKAMPALPELGRPTPLTKPATEAAISPELKALPQTKTSSRAAVTKEAAPPKPSQPPKEAGKLEEENLAVPRAPALLSPRPEPASVPPANGFSSVLTPRPLQITKLTTASPEPKPTEAQVTVIPIGSREPGVANSAGELPTATPKPLIITFDRPPPSVSQAASKKETTPPPGDAYVSRGVIVLPSSERQESVPPKSDAYVSSGVVLFQTQEKTAPKADAKFSRGVILFDSTEAVRTPKVRPDRLAKQSRLQHAIAKACGKPSKEVEVKLLSEKELVVSIKAHSAREGEALSRAIFQMPELGPYQVSLDIPLLP